MVHVKKRLAKEVRQLSEVKYLLNTTIIVFRTLLLPGYAPDNYVYIIYGGDESYGDRVKTSYDGTYEFKYLREGNYKIYVYSKDSTQSIYTIPAGKYPVSADVEVGKKDKLVEVPDLVIFDNI